MSMISMQVDRLRDRAMRVEIFLEGSTDAIPTDTHIQLRDAADTIWELRNKMCGMVDARERARVLESENAKLRAERDEWHRVAVSKQDIIDHMRDARADNAKLRELAHDMWRLLLATGNDDLVLSVAVNGVVKEVIDAEELAKAMCDLGIEETDWQTIADKLNATLGVGTCYPVPIYSFNGEFTEYDCDACSECGTEWDGDMPNFCPNCGLRVMEADE